MSNTNQQQKNFLEKLNDEEIQLVINMISEDVLIEQIKKHPGEFSNETKGIKIDKKSKLLKVRLPDIYLKKIKRRDVNCISIINDFINYVINKINTNVIEKTKNENYLRDITIRNDVEIFSNLIEAILKELQPKYIFLYFKLIGHELSIEQNDYVQLLIEKRALREEITKELESKYKDQISNIENLNKEEISKQMKKVKKLQDILNSKSSELKDEKKYTQELLERISEINKGNTKNINTFKKQIEELNKSFEIIKEEKSKLMSTIKENGLIIESLSKSLNLKDEEFYNLTKEKWDLNNKDLLETQSSLENINKSLIEKEIVLKESIELLENKKIQIENEISKYRNYVNDFIDNIDIKLIEKALDNTLIKLPQSTNEFITKPYIRNYEVHDKTKLCQNVQEFSENIASNLESIGVKEIADESANYIIGILASGIIPLICGYKSREIATAISAAYCGETPFIISLPNGYTNSKELVDIYNKSEANVVLIEDAIGTMNENSLMPLLREKLQIGFTRKILLIATENLDSLKYMPSNILNYVALIIIDKYGIPKKVPYEFSNSIKILEEFMVLDNFEYEYKKIKKLLSNLKFDSQYKILRSLIVAYAHKLSNSNIAFQGYVRSELKFLANCNNMITDLEKNIQIHQLGDNLLQIINGDLNE